VWLLEVNVVPRELGPTISALGPTNLEIVAGRLSQEIPFGVAWTNSENPSKLKVWAESGDETAVPSKDVLLHDRGTNWTAQVWPAHAASNEVYAQWSGLLWSLSRFLGSGTVGYREAV